MSAARLGRLDDVLLQQQAKALTSHKPDKTTHITVEGVPTSGLTGIQKRQTGDKFPDVYGKELTKKDYEIAHDAGCDYALYTVVTDTFSQMGSPPSTSISPPSQPGPFPPRNQSAPETSLIVIYRLHRINPSAMVGEGIIPVHAAAPENVVIADGLNAAANQAFQKIAKDPQLPVKKP